LREVISRYSENTHRLEVDNPIVTVDVNSPKDLQNAEELFVGM
jgi:CTP:molybdopterin cytidylyltransferase MocA